MIHIGYHKTGTSWLQKHLFDRLHNGFYPLTEVNSSQKLSSKQLANKFIFQKDGTYLSSLHFDRDVLEKELKEGVDLSGHGIPVISHERLSGNAHSGGFDSREIALRLSDVFPEAKIFIVIREQCSMILSTYFQYLKIGGARSLRDYLMQIYDGRIPMFSLHHFEYHYLIKQYQDLFGQHNVLVLPYELFCLQPHQFVNRLSEFSGAEIPKELEIEDKVNEGIDRFIESKTRMPHLFSRKCSVNAYSPLCTSKSRVIVKLAKAFLGAVLSERISRGFAKNKLDEVRCLVRSYYCTSHKITSQLTGLDLSSYGYK